MGSFDQETVQNETAGGRNGAVGGTDMERRVRILILSGLQRNGSIYNSILCDGRKCISQEARPTIGTIQRPRTPAVALRVRQRYVRAVNQITELQLPSRVCAMPPDGASKSRTTSVLQSLSGQWISRSILLTAVDDVFTLAPYACGESDARWAGKGQRRSRRYVRCTPHPRAHPRGRADVLSAENVAKQKLLGLLDDLANFYRAWLCTHKGIQPNDASDATRVVVSQVGKSDGSSEPLLLHWGMKSVDVKAVGLRHTEEQAAHAGVKRLIRLGKEGAETKRMSGGWIRWGEGGECRWR